MSKRRFVIDPRGNRIEVETTYDPADHLTSKRRRAPTGQRFALLTEERLKLLAGLSGAAWAIYCYLLKINWKDLNQPVKLTNGMLAEIGVSSDAKLRALPQLKRVGLIKVKKAGNQALTVTPLK